MPSNRHARFSASASAILIVVGKRQNGLVVLASGDGCAT